MKLHRLLFILLAAVSCCRTADEASQWDAPDSWYDNGEAVNPDFVDVFYLLSTDVVSSHDSLGNVSYTAVLTPEEREPMSYELNSTYTKIFPDSLNFFAPYYHQYTMDAISLEPEDFKPIYEKVTAEVLDAFDYYMEHLNGGRRFILAGFSQGADHVVDILKHLSEEQYSRMVAAYVIGFKLTPEDLESPNIVPADNADDTGVTVSFNSVASPDAVWDFVNGGAAVCTNPVNWTTDSTAAEFEYEGDVYSVSVDPEINSLIVSGIDIDEFRFPMLDPFCKPGNLHHWDIKFYRPSIRENALHRAYGSR